MTNHHVIKNADEVVVSLADGRSFDAKILGEDADLDIAILEIEDAENLEEVSMLAPQLNAFDADGVNDEFNDSNYYRGNKYSKLKDNNRYFLQKN